MVNLIVRYEVSFHVDNSPDSYRHIFSLTSHYNDTLKSTVHKNNMTNSGVLCILCTVVSPSTCLALFSVSMLILGTVVFLQIDDALKKPIVIVI